MVAAEALPALLSFSLQLSDVPDQMTVCLSLELGGESGGGWQGSDDFTDINV